MDENISSSIKFVVVPKIEGSTPGWVVWMVAHSLLVIMY